MEALLQHQKHNQKQSIVIKGILTIYRKMLNTLPISI